jgi:hypothetical protein
MNCLCANANLLRDFNATISVSKKKRDAALSGGKTVEHQLPIPSAVIFSGGKPIVTEDKS